LNRNIITIEDIALAKSSSATRGAGDSNIGQDQADGYLEKIVKLVPAEIIGAYLVLEGILKSGLSGDPQGLYWGLAAIFLLGAIGAMTFARRILEVQRLSQLAVTGIAFCVWVFATGGWFAFVEWYAPWMGSVSVVLFAMLVRILKVRPLPDPSLI
jgi:hypothetical protein